MFSGLSYWWQWKLKQTLSKYHMGLGIFIDTINLTKIVINSPMNLIYQEGNLYIDKFDQAIQNVLNNINSMRTDKSLDFKKYTINQEYKKQLQEEVFIAGMGKEIPVIKVSLENITMQPGLL